METKEYPSIICGQKNDKDVKNSLVILQKKLDFKKAKSDIENVLFQNISEEVICANEKLHWHGYSDNEDMININIWYLTGNNAIIRAGCSDKSICYSQSKYISFISGIRNDNKRNKKTFLLYNADIYMVWSADRIYIISDYWQHIYK